MNNRIGEGRELNLTAPAGGVVSGKFYLIGALLVCAGNTAPAGAKFPAWRVGEHVNQPAEGAANGQAWTEGLLLYWDNANSRFTTTAAGNTKAAVATAAKASADVTGNICLVPSL